MVTGLHHIASGTRQSALRLAAVPPCERLQRSDQLLALHRALAAAIAPERHHARIWHMRWRFSSVLWGVLGV